MIVGIVEGKEGQQSAIAETLEIEDSKRGMLRAIGSKRGVRSKSYSKRAKIEEEQKIIDEDLFDMKQSSKIKKISADQG